MRTLCPRVSVGSSVLLCSGDPGLAGLELAEKPLGGG